MPITPVSPAGKYGIVHDLAPAEIPQEAWDDCMNVRFRQLGAELCPEAQNLYGAASVAPYWGTHARDNAGHLIWLYAGASKAYCIDSGTHSNVTRQNAGVDVDYTTDRGLRWTGGNLGSIPVLANAKDLPQAWISPSAATKLQNLPNWPSTARCGCIGVYKNFLVALDITKVGTRYPTLVKWSHPADPGTVPSSWDETDPTKDAGEFPLSETGGYCVFQLPLKDINIIYKQDSVWGMQYIGGTLIFRFYKIFGHFGCPGKHQVVALPDGRHVVFTGRDLMIHNGQEAQSISQGKIRNILNGISEGVFPYVFLTVLTQDREVWLCWPSSVTSPGCDNALVWNWEEETFSRRTLPNLHHATEAVLDFTTGPDTWATDSISWAASTEVWDLAAQAPLLPRPVGLKDTELIWLNSLSSSFTSSAYLLRSSLGFPAKAGMAPDVSAMKFLRRLWPRITGTVGDTLTIEIGRILELNEAVVWKETRVWTIGTTKKLDVTITGITFAIRISSASGSVWKLAGIDWDWSLSGEN